MKKLFLTICLTAMLSTPAIAACDGGTEYTVDGDTFCMSDINLNWWSAANWCKANGMHLATMYEACPDWNGTKTAYVCGRTFSSYGTLSWSATVSGGDRAFGVEPSTGYVNDSVRSAERRAVCTN